MSESVRVTLRMPVALHSLIRALAYEKESSLNAEILERLLAFDNAKKQIRKLELRVKQLEKDIQGVGVHYA